MERRTFYVTVEIDQDVPMPARAVVQGIEARIVGDGFTGRASATSLHFAEWACIRCNYHNSGLVCTHCGRPLVDNGSQPSGGEA